MHMESLCDSYVHGLHIRIICELFDRKKFLFISIVINNSIYQNFSINLPGVDKN